MTDHLHAEPQLEIPGVPSDLIRVRKLVAHERIGRPWEVWVDFVATDPGPVDEHLECGAKVHAAIFWEDAVARTFRGIVTDVEDALDTETKHAAFRVRIAPRVHRLDLVKKQAIHMDLSTPEIAKKKLEQLGLVDGKDFVLRLSEPHAKREFVTQYKETDLAFVSRLLEHEGIALFFEEAEGGERLVLTDHGPGFAKGEPVSFRGRGDRRDVFDLDLHRRLLPEHYIVSDYNWRRPLLDLTSVAQVKRGGVAGGVVEYGTHVKDPDEAERIARVRSGEADASRLVYRGRSDRPGLAAGSRVRIEGHKRLGDAEILVTEVRHTCSQPLSGEAAGVRSYENEFRAVPGDVSYRPPRETPVPRIDGVVNATVEGGDHGAPATMDAEGRYWVRFAFDVEGQDGGGRSSRPIRMAQPHAGAGYGMHFPLRPGTEVLVIFVDGDPDRPVIMGSVPNPVTASPVTATNHKVNKMKTASGCVLEFFDGDD